MQQIYSAISGKKLHWTGSVKNYFVSGIINILEVLLHSNRLEVSPLNTHTHPNYTLS